METDIAIVGAGPAGLSFARLLASSGLHITVIDRQSGAALAVPEFDGRDIALTRRSVCLLRELGVWQRLADEDRPEIRRARVLDGNSPYTLDFDPAGRNDAALGHIVSNHLIRQALYAEVCSLDNVELRTGTGVEDLKSGLARATLTLADGNTLRARLIAAADSRFSETRRMAGISASMHDFGRVCIVCRMTHEEPHDATAFECFHYERTLAILPLTSNESSIVVTAGMDQRDAIMAMSDTAFADDIRRRFGSRYGCMTLSSKRFAYPLVGVHATRFHGGRVALVGDAAVGMHPVTAHGYNLGLSGAALLARLVIRAAARGDDIGAGRLLQAYSLRHQLSTRPMYHGTNEIVKIFTDDRKPARLVRTMALRAANRLPAVRRAIRHKLTYA
tara:strand:+ start:3117 stop:4286 length:1170 start_codon:yes stop_codon:yes gene_type:complete